jgi:hypothetical protein
MYCLHCGQELPNNAAYCVKCGKAFSGVSTNTNFIKKLSVRLQWFKKPSFLIITLLVICLIGAGSYYLYAKDTFVTRPPHLEVNKIIRESDPKNRNTFTVSGITDPGCTLEVDGISHPVNKDGSFDFVHTISEPSTWGQLVKIVFVSMDKKGRKTTLVRRVKFVASENTTQPVYTSPSSTYTPHQSSSGSQLHVCPSCSGIGTTECYACQGMGSTACYSCDSAGYKSCLNCGGTGRVWSYVSDESQVCYSCGGTGREKCTSCNGTGREKCYTCNGTGREKCLTCNGTGKVSY